MHDLSRLECLILIDAPSLIKGTCYFEFAAGDFAGDPLHRQPGSLFISDDGFTYFHNVFERAHPEYDYYSYTRFGPDQLHGLINELELFLRKVRSAQTMPQLEKCFSPHIASTTICRGPSCSRQVAAISQAGSGILAYTRRALEERQCMWLLGM